MNEFDAKTPLNEEEEITVITLTSEEGAEIELELLDTIEYEGGQYAVLLPLAEEEDEDETDVIILLVEKEDDDEYYTEVENDDILNAVFEIFKEHFADEIDFVE